MRRGSWKWQEPKNPIARHWKRYAAKSRPLHRRVPTLLHNRDLPVWFYGHALRDCTDVDTLPMDGPRSLGWLWASFGLSRGPWTAAFTSSPPAGWNTG